MSKEAHPVLPEEIEARSFAIIAAELGHLSLPEEYTPVVKRVIHATADFEYARSLHFSPGVVPAALRALKEGRHIVTDTTMAAAGINKSALAAFGGEVHCLIGDPDVARSALERGTTRSRAAVDKAAAMWPDAIYVVGNAPTALIRIVELVREARLEPAFVVAVPVGFVNVVESKEAVLLGKTPCIVARGRKGGSNIAAAICNALLKMT